MFTVSSKLQLGEMYVQFYCFNKSKAGVVRMLLLGVSGDKDSKKKWGSATANIFIKIHKCLQKTYPC